MSVANLKPVFADVMAAHVELCNLPHAGNRPSKAERDAEKRLNGLLAGLSARDRVMLGLACSAIMRRVAAL